MTPCSIVVCLLLGVILLTVLATSTEAKPTGSDSKALEELLELDEAASQPSYRYLNRAFESSDPQTKRQLQAYAETGAPRNAMDMMRALIALRRYR